MASLSSTMPSSGIGSMETQKLKPYHMENLYTTLSKTPCGSYIEGKKQELTEKQKQRFLSGTTIHEVHRLLGTAFQYKEAPGHRYLFLTKNPQRYIDLYKAGLLPEGDDYWYGSTATDDEMPMFWSDRHRTFASMEPVLGSFDGKIVADEMKNIDWFILGAETGNRKGKVTPKREWIEAVVEYARSTGKPVFMKDSMKPIWGDDIITEFPWSE